MVISNQYGIYSNFYHKFNWHNCINKILIIDKYPIKLIIHYQFVKY